MHNLRIINYNKRKEDINMEGFKRMLESTDIEVLREYFYEAVGHYPNGLDKNQIIQVLLIEEIRK